ncbi:MAG: signal peptidase II [Treponema sp.]|nr:signal peptidase II [Treponema sp.]
MLVNNNKSKTLPFSLSALVILLDQAVKIYIVSRWPLQGSLIKDVFGNDFLYIYHVRNRAIAFSLGQNLPDNLRPLLFIIVPILVLGFLIWFYFSSQEFSWFQRWAFAGIIGGGIGNIIDRIFRPDGVVDFISVKIYGLFGMDRWPTFNIADSSVVVCCFLFFIGILIGPENSGRTAET